MNKSISLLLAFVMLVSLIAPVSVYAGNEITVTVNFDEAQSQNQSKQINIPNLGEIKSVTANTGNATYLVNGENVTVNATGGTPSRTENITNYTEGWINQTKTQSSQTFADTITATNYKGETITLAKDGAPFVVSGSYTPSDSKTVVFPSKKSTNSFALNHNYSVDGYVGVLAKQGGVTSVLISGTYLPYATDYISAPAQRIDYQYAITGAEGGWKGWGDYIITATSGYGTFLNGDILILKYNYNGYTGNLSLQNTNQTLYRPFNSPMTPNTTYLQAMYYYDLNYVGTITRPTTDTRVYEYTQNYSGTVTKPAVDSRVYGQNYKLWTVTGEARSVKNYYSYSVDLTYELNYTVDLANISSELDNMKILVISRQVDTRLDEFNTRLTTLNGQLNDMPSNADVNLVKVKLAQVQKIINIVKLIKQAEANVSQEAIYNAGNLINQIEDPIIAEALEGQLNEAGDVSSVVKAIQKAQTTYSKSDITIAIKKVKSLDNSHPQKAEFIAQIEAVRLEFNASLSGAQTVRIKKDAIYYTTQVEAFGTVFYLNKAMFYIEQLEGIDNVLKATLEARLNAVSGKITSNTTFLERQALKQLEIAEAYKIDSLVVKAQGYINMLKTGAVKNEYQVRLNLLK